MWHRRLVPVLHREDVICSQCPTCLNPSEVVGQCGTISFGFPQ